MNRGMGPTLQALAVVAVEPSDPEERAEPDEELDRPPLSWRRLRLITCDVVLDQLEDLVRIVAKATHWRRIFRTADRIGDLRPLQVYECSCCGRREIDALCRFSDEQVVCETCLNGVVRRANVGVRPPQKRMDRKTLEAILALEVTPYWQQDPDEYRPSEREAEAIAALAATHGELRMRWFRAMAPVARSLKRFMRIVNEHTTDGAG